MRISSKELSLLGFPMMALEKKYGAHAVNKVRGQAFRLPDARAR